MGRVNDLGAALNRMASFLKAAHPDVDSEKNHIPFVAESEFDLKTCNFDSKDGEGGPTMPVDNSVFYMEPDRNDLPVPSPSIDSPTMARGP